MADIRKDGNAEIELRNVYAYNSGLIWHSYKEYCDGIRKPETDYKIDGVSGMSGSKRVSMLIDVSNAAYAVLDESITSDAGR